MGTLYTLIIGFFGGVLGALGTDFLRAPIQQFRTLRREIRNEMLRLANVPAPDPKWSAPVYDQATLDRLLGPSREAKATFRMLGTRIMAFAETEGIAVRFVRSFGYDPLDAGRGLIGLSNSFAEYGAERASHRARINKALRLPD